MYMQNHSNTNTDSDTDPDIDTDIDIDTDTDTSGNPPNKPPNTNEAGPSVYVKCVCMHRLTRRQTQIQAQEQTHESAR